MPTPRETILTALHARLPATDLRGVVLPERVPAEVLLILGDGEPGEPEITLSLAMAELLPVIEAVMVTKLNEELAANGDPGFRC